jgi:hypothetical protein
MAETKPYSICFRLRRTTVEDAFVRVPINGAVMQPRLGEDGTLRLDTDRVIQLAVSLGNDASTKWIIDGQPVVEAHPLQMAPTDGR